MKISAKKKAITAAVRMSEDDLRLALEEALDSDECEEIVNAAYGYSDYFTDACFMDMNEFFAVHLDNMEPLDAVKEFWDGDDLDGDDHANPYKDYARYDSNGNVETTDYPGDVYYNDLLDDIIDYIVENYDSRYDEFPDDIQELIDQYTDYLENEDSEEDEDSSEEE